MQTLINFGISLIIAVQGMGDWLIVPMKLFSYLGNEEFFMFVLPLLYWSVDSALGLRVGLILVTSNLFNNVFKLIFAGPRPYWVSSHVRALWTSETSFGIPSGHAQNAVTIWGMMAAYGKRTWVWVTAIALMFLIGFSRIFLAAHFPHDVVFGWFLGAILLWAFMRFWDPIAAWVSPKTLSQKIIIAFITSMLFVALGFGVTTFRSGFQIPADWINNAALVNGETPDPLSPDGTFTSAGIFFGLASGAAWIMSIGGYQAAGPVQKRAIRYVIGLIGVLILYMGLGAIFPRNPDLISYALRYVRYTLIGFWVSAGAPWTFIKMKLADRS
ncbi:MAG: phosphatase PAP2 family protein [Chloroflexi bacterium]|nr:phosphatase PAP2 family protein [Chloroflexota bacterium]